MKGYFGEFGGQYVAETLMKSLSEIEETFELIKDDTVFMDEFRENLIHYCGRPTPLYYAPRFSKEVDAQIYLKREDLNHTGAHKINNVMGQILLAKKMNKQKIIAETGAGQHGVATATVCAKYNMECTVYMGALDVARQSVNVEKMKLLGATVVPVHTGTKTLKDATSEAIRAWAREADTAFYLIGSVVGPHPYPTMVRHFQKIIGEEVKLQIDMLLGRQADMLVACVGGGSNAMGLFHPFVEAQEIQLIGVEALGRGTHTIEHAATMKLGTKGILHGMKTKVLQDSYGQINEAYSISAGLDYPGIGPEHAYLDSIKRVSYEGVTDAEAVNAFETLTLLEGIFPALESSHAIAWVLNNKEKVKGKVVVINLSGRGDKDLDNIICFQKGERIHE